MAPARQSRPGRTIAHAACGARSGPSRSSQPSTRCRPRALTPSFWLVTNHIARNHSATARCVLKHRAGRRRCAPTTTPAPQQPLRHRPRLPDHTAVRAGETIRPTESPDILPASRVAAEPLAHLLECPWVIDPTDRMFGAPSAHATISQRSVKGIRRLPKKARRHRGSTLLFFSMAGFETSNFSSSGSKAMRMRIVS